jgi:ornithine cyclodeaminase
MISPAWIDEASVASALHPSDLVAAMTGAFIDPPIAPKRGAIESDDGDGQTRVLLTMPALRPGGLAMVKTVIVKRGHGVDLHSQVMVYDRSGAAIAVVQGHELTARRTAAASALAAQSLGASGSERLAVIGAGRQARAQIAAYAATMPIKHISIWARRSEAAAELARFASHYGAIVSVATAPAEAAAGAQVVTCVTGSTKPLLTAEDVAPGAHIDLVGGFRPDMREVDDLLIARGAVVADSAAALDEAGDLLGPISSGAIAREDVQLLGDILRGDPLRRRGDITIFKSVGHAAEDLVAVELLMRKLRIGESAA